MKKIKLILTFDTIEDAIKALDTLKASGVKPKTTLREDRPNDPPR